MRHFSKGVLVIYLITLTWLVLFKFSFEPLAVLAGYQSRSLNFIPFMLDHRNSVGEIVSNLIVFMPFGLLLGVNLKKLSALRNIAIIFAFSLTAEVVQFIFAIGTTDITDLIMNTMGGAFGLATYKAANKYIGDKTLNLLITITGAILLLGFYWLRIFVFKVRY